jgi:dTMP kinase
MKIYFTAATTNNGDYIPQETAIITEIKKFGHTLTSGEQILDHAKLDLDAKRTPEEIFQREKQAIDDADCVVAEVTKPSSGVGGELVYALSHHKPVLALFYKDAANELSAMITGNPSDHLYLEHYDEESLPIILKHYLAQVLVEKNRHGKLIVIDGGDGSGKTTQSKLLMQYLKDHNVPVKMFDFPRYYSSFHGKMVGRFLAGEFGKLDDVSPYLSSLAYALDRAAAKEELDTWLAHGGTIVCNRYATSNMAHQAAKLPEDKRQEYLEWIDELEYKVHKIPREDIVVYLHVPWQFGMELTKNKGDRAYLKGHAQDIAEADVRHRQAAEVMYLTLASKRKNWVLVECVKDGKVLPKEEIHQHVLAALRGKKIIE